MPVLQQAYLDLRVGFVPDVQDRWEDAEGDRVHGRELELAAFQSGRTTGRGAGSARVGEGGASVRQHRAAHRGQPDRTWQTFQERASAVPFQGADLVG